MQRTIQPATGPIQAKIMIPGSKSITHRALLLAALAEGVSEISGIYLGQSTRTLIKALHQLGIVAQLDEKTGSCIIAGCNGQLPKRQATLWCGNTLSNTYFLIAACAASPGVYYFDGATTLREKKISPILDALSRHGVQFIPSQTRKMPFTLVGADSLDGSEMILNKAVNKQLISALLIIAPYARSPFIFTVLNAIPQPSIDLTCGMMADFGVLVHRVHQGQFMVPVPQRYQAKDYAVEPNISLASYFFAAAAVTGGEITIPPIKRSQSKQLDMKQLALFEKMGCHLQETHQGLTLQGPNELTGVEINMQYFSDLFLVFAAMAPFAKTPTKISHIGMPQKKELARLTAMKNGLIKMGIHVETGDHWIKIFPGMPHGRIVSSDPDYRIAMAFSIIGLKTPGVIIEDNKTIHKVYPDFFAHWDKLAKTANVSV